MQATVVLVVAVGTTISLSLQHSRLRRLSGENDLASIACRNNLEDLRSVKFADLKTLNNTGFDVPAVNGSPGGLRPVPGDADGLAGRFRVTEEAKSGSDILYRVVAEVTWVGVAGRRTIEFTSLFADRRKK